MKKNTKVLMDMIVRIPPQPVPWEQWAIVAGAAMLAVTYFFVALTTSNVFRAVLCPIWAGVAWLEWRRAKPVDRVVLPALDKEKAEQLLSAVVDAVAQFNRLERAAKDDRDDDGGIDLGEGSGDHSRVA